MASHNNWLWGALFGALLVSFIPTASAFKFDDNINYEELKVGDQRSATMMQKWYWMTLPSAIKQKKVVLPCNLTKKKTTKIKIIFFDKRKNYTIKTLCKKDEQN